MDNTSTTKSPIIAREHFRERLEARLHHGAAPVALALLDVDGFARVNEEHGTVAGDLMLAGLETALARNLPEDAELLRLGGDEYVAILPGASAENALIGMDEIRTHVGQQSLGGGAPTRFSAGVAANPPHGATAVELWRAAGQALMRAKREGGDRVAMYVEEKMVLKSNYYSRANLDRLAKLSAATDRTEASLLREGLDDLIEKYDR